jgi:hypothetical protein
MSWCLAPEKVAKFKKGLRDGDINPAELAGMASLERRAFLEGFVGKENAIQVNSMFESKLLLKNQITGMKTWIKRVAGITKQTKRDLISRVERMDKILDPKETEQFLQDLASTKLGIGVIQEEAKNIMDLSRKISELKTKANDAGIFPSEEQRMEYGMSQVTFKNYIDELKLKTGKEGIPRKIIKFGANVPGILKSAVASMDNSFWGRQGIKNLLDLRTSPIWTKNFLKSWVDMGKQLMAKGKLWTSGDDAVMDSIKADVLSRPNALNGKYEAGNYGLDVLSEEAYPSSLPEKIPLLGRVFKASEVAYNGGALRLRADLADRFIKMAEKNGVNTLDRKEIQPVGQMVSSLTGRGSNYLRATGEQQKALNVLLFSVKFLESNVDTLIKPLGLLKKSATKGEAFTKKESAKSLLSIMATLATMKLIAKAVNPNSVDIEPRSTNFCKIKVWGHWVDTSGGMASLVTLVSRTMIPTKHNGEWGLWTKSSTGNWTNLTAGEYGKQTALDVLEGFIEGKLSPLAGIVRDLLKGENYQGQPITLENMAINATVPLSIQNFIQLKDDPNSSSILGSMVLDSLGFSTSTYNYKTDWTTSTSKEMEQFKDKVGNDKFIKANDDYNRAYNEWYSKISITPEFKRLSDDGQTSLITKAKDAIKEQIFKEYHFKYVEVKPTKQEESETKQIKKMVPK